MNEDSAITGVIGALLGFLANWFAGRKKLGAVLKQYEDAKGEVGQLRAEIEANNKKLDEKIEKMKEQDAEIARLGTALTSAMAKLDEDFKPGDESAEELAARINAGPGPDVSDA